MNSTLRLSALMAATAVLTACGGGGGGDAAPSTSPPGTGGSGGGATNPPPVPVNEAEKYQATLENYLRQVLGIEAVAKTLLQVPANIKTEVEAHGPFTRCQHSACPDTVDTSQWATFPYVAGGNVRLQDWLDAPTGPTGPDGTTPTDGQYGFGDIVKLDLQGISTNPSLSATVSLSSPSDASGAYGFSFTSNHEQTRDGLLLNGNLNVLFRGQLFATLNNGKYTIVDHLQNDADRQLIVEEKNAQGQTAANWMSNLTVTTNAADRDAITFDIDMVNYFGGGALKFKSGIPINLIELNGKMQLESGSFTYEFNDPSQAKKWNLRVTVDADPAFLFVEIDEDIDGTYEKSGRLAQNDFDYSY